MTETGSSTGSEESPPKNSHYVDEAAGGRAQPSAGRPPSHARRIEGTGQVLGRIVQTLWPVLLGAALGAAVGFAVGVLSVPRPLAVARIEVMPSPILAGESEATFDMERFIQAELLVLGGEDLSGAVAQSMRLSEPLEVTATEVGTTDVVELNVRASSESEAVTATQALITAYGQRRAGSLLARVDASLTVVDGQLNALTSAQDPGSVPEYTRLLAVRNQLQLVRDSDQGQVTVVLQPRVVEQSRWLGGFRNSIMGLVLGALLGMLVMLLRARSIRTAAAVADSRT